MVNNLNTVSTGLAANDQDLSNLINNVDAMASQTNSLVSQDSPALNSLLSSLHADLGVVGQHQDDLAEGVSYLGSALKGFQSIAYSGSHAGALGQHLREPGLAEPDVRHHRPLRHARPGPQPGARARPGRCDQQTGPLPGDGLERRAGRRAPRRRAGRRRRRTTSTTAAGSSNVGQAVGLLVVGCRAPAGRTPASAACPSSSARCCRREK